MKHIALITTSFPDLSFQPGQEAAGTFVSDFAQELAKHVQVSVVAPSKQDSLTGRGNLKIKKFSVPSLPLSLLKPDKPSQWRNIITTMKNGQSALKQLVDETTVDHIFALWALPSGYWARAVWKKHGIPYSIWALGSDIWELGKISIVKKVLRMVLQDSHARFADGYMLRKDIETISGKDCNFLPSVRNLPISKSKKLCTGPPYRLAFLGRWHLNKGVDLLVEGLQLLTQDDWNKIEKVQVCGGGPLEKAVLSRCAKLKEAGHPVVVRGYLNKMDALELLMWADYILIPSRVESIPLIFSDAMQTNCPVIATPVGDLPRLINCYNTGILSSNVSARAIHLAIREAILKSPYDYADGFKNVRKVFDLKQAAINLLYALKGM